MKTLEVAVDRTPPPPRRRRKVEAGASKLGSPKARVSSERRKNPSAETLVSSGLPSNESSPDSKYCVRDFVWGQVKSNLWWPGKVIDTLENVTSGQRKIRSLLVSFFGDGTTVWCEQSQLKQFKEEFRQMVNQSKSLSFVSAVVDALDEIRNCFDSENTCYCSVEKNPAKVGWERGHLAEKYGESDSSGRLPIANYSVTEFLDHLGGAAQDVMVADMLEVTVLLSWVTSFRQSNWCSLDLVGESQIDDQPVDVSKDKVEEEFRVSDNRVVKRPEISKELKPRKERSIAELIAGPNIRKEEHDVDNETKGVDLNKLDTSTSTSSSLHRKRKKKDEMNEKSIVDNSEHKAVEGTGSGSSLEMDSHKRVRKMSKYLSPPYLYISGYSKRAFFTDDATVGVPDKEFKASESILIGSPQNLEENQEVSRKEGDKFDHLFIDDGASADKILHEFLATATNHLHLKWNRSANKVRNFFDKFRSYTYAEGPHFEAYKKLLDSLSSLDGSSTKHDSSGVSGKGKSSRRRIEGKNEANQEMPLEQSNEMTSKAPKRRKYDKKDNIIGETHLTVDLSSVNGQKEVKCEKKRQKSKCDALAQNIPECSHVLVDPTKKCNTKSTTVRGKIIDNGSSPVLKSQKLANHSEASNSYRRSKGRKALHSSSVDMDQQPANGSEESSLKKRRKTKDGSNSENPGALNLTFVPDSTLPSKDELVSTFVKFGIVIESETELLKDSCSACVMFARAIDAKKAFKGLEEGGILQTSVAKYKLYFPQRNINSPSPKSPVVKTPLPYIKKSLEKMIAKLTGSTSDKDMSSPNQLRPELASNLLGDMEGMLKKVKKLLTEPSAGSLV